MHETVASMNNSYTHDLVGLHVGLMPIKPEAVYGSTIEFKCDYNHSYPMFIYFKLTPYNGLPLTAWAMEPGPHVPTNSGAYRLWNVHIGQYPCSVECTILDHLGNELAKLSTSILPGFLNESHLKSCLSEKLSSVTHRDCLQFNIDLN
ncbi:uncharacterized protein [Chelonus insularis]|uniref:uncharacterized protein n=1 Tax=Chelonus insularis TaxID=460826 RepID=UPI0015891B74|nr:uncharacterized protein LOC118071119 [Chelonus insularis]